MHRHNSASSWENRPPTATAIPNLLLVGDYVQTGFDIASMEAACESGRAAANAVLAGTGSNADRVPTFQRYSAPEFDTASGSTPSATGAVAEPGDGSPV